MKMDCEDYIRTQPNLLNSEEEARKNSNLVLTTPDKKSGIGRERGGITTRSNASLYDGIYLELVGKTPTRVESKRLSPQSSVKQSPSNGVSPGKGQKPAQNKNLPIYEEEDFNKPIEELSNCVQSPKWEDLGITPLLKTDLYKDILETIPEVKNKVDEIEQNQLVTSPKNSTFTKLDEKINPDDAENVNSLLNNHGATCISVLKDLYDDVEPESTLQKTQSNSSLIEEDKGVENISSVSCIENEGSGNQTDVEVKEDETESVTREGDDAIVESDEPGDKLQDGYLDESAASASNEIEENSEIAIPIDLDQDLLKNSSTKRDIDSPAPSVDNSEIDSECKPPVLDCYPKEDVNSNHLGANSKSFTTPQSLEIQNFTVPPPSEEDNSSNNVPVLTVVVQNSPINEQVTLNETDTLHEEAPTLSLEGYIVSEKTEAEELTHAESENIYYDVENSNILVENLPSDIQYVELDLSAVQALQEQQGNAEKGEVALEHLVLADGQLRIVQSGEQIVLECVKDDLSLSVNIESSTELSKHSEELQYNEVTNNFEVVTANDVETEVVLSHSQEEVVRDTAISDVEPVLSQSERFYRKYIPGKRMPSNPVYDLPESSFVTSGGSDNENDNANHSTTVLDTEEKTKDTNFPAVKCHPSDPRSYARREIKTEIIETVENVENENQFDAVTKNFSDGILKNVSDESQTSDSSSLISQKENGTLTEKYSSQMAIDDGQASQADNSESSESKERSSTKEHSIKRKYRKSGSSTVHGSSSEGSGSPATEDQPVRRSSRIKSLEEKREKQREFNRKKDPKHKKGLKKLVVATSLMVTGLEAVNQDASQDLKDSSLNSSDENKKNDSNNYSRQDSTESPFLNASSISPLADPRRRTTDNDPRRPEKVKSRWRRSSEMERVHSNSPISLPFKVLNNNQSYADSSTSNSDATVTVKEEDKNEKEKMPNFDIIDENIYLFERKKSKSKKEVRRMACDCTLTKEEREEGFMGCLDDCLNRLLMIECGSRCMLGNLCANKRFSKKENGNAAAFKTEKKGWGLKAQEHMESGTFIMEYVGEVLSAYEFNQRVKRYAREKLDHYYFMALKGDEIIDATLKGNISRFINHSCDPNCETQKWTVNGELRIGFFTRRDVKPNEELTFDYQFQRYGREAQKCYCEASNCRGYIGEPGEEKQVALEEDALEDEIESEEEIVLEKLPASTKTPIITPKKKRFTTVEEKKKEEPEDVALEKELEKLTSIGGLKNREQTLMLNRLMVRAETRETRQKLLDIIQNTSEQACLRLFLDYHGLTLLWSWMVDLGNDAVLLKKQILEILTLLPISNKTILLDSKVLSVVQRWAIPDETPPVETTKTEKTDESELLKETETAELSSGTPSGCATPVVNDNAIEASVEPTNLVLPKDIINDIIEEEIPAKKLKLDDNAIKDDIPEVKTEKPVDLNTNRVKREVPEIVVVVLSKSRIPSPKIETVPVLPIWSSIDDELESEDICLSDIVVGQVLRKLVNDVCERNIVPDPIRLTEMVEPKNEIQEERVRESDIDKKLDQSTDIPMETTEPPLPEPKIDIPSLASILLESWSSLKEIFRIPRLEHQKRKQDELAASSILSDRERDSRDYYDSPSRRRDSEYNRRRDRSPRGRDDDRRFIYDDGHERKPKKFGPPQVSTGPKLSKEERRQLFELEVQQRDQEEIVRRQQEYLARVKAMEMANAVPAPQEFVIPTVYDTGEPPFGPHPDYIPQVEYAAPIDYPIEFAGQIDYARGSYDEAMDFTEVNEYTGPPPDYATESYEYDPLTGTYNYDPDKPVSDLDPTPPGLEFPEPSSVLIEVYPPPSGIIPPMVSFISSKVSRDLNSDDEQDGDEGDDDDDEDDEEFEEMEDDDDDFQPRTIQPSLLRATASSPAPKPISPYPSPTEDQSPVDVQSPENSPKQEEFAEMLEIPSPSQIPLPDSPAPVELDNIESSPEIESPVKLNATFLRDESMELPETFKFNSSPQEESTPTGSPVHFGSPIQLSSSPLGPTKLPRPTPSIIPIEGLVHVPQSLSSIPLPDRTPTPEATPEQQQDDDSEAVRPHSPTQLPMTLSYDPPSLIQSFLQKMVEANSSPASPLPLSHSVISPTPTLAAPLITSPAPGLMSPIAAGATATFVPGQSPFLSMNPQGGPIYYVQPSGAVVPINDQSALAGVAGAVPLVHVAMAPQGVEENLTPPVPTKPKRYKLPPSWKTAKDGEGNIYYYHSVTRQTQWDPPPGSVEEDEPPMEEESPAYQETPTTHHKHSKRRTTTAVADTSSESAKRMKEKFRSKMSSYIVQCLNPYRKLECKVGRITNTDDFKHLARKLTHFVMAKELKHCKNVEDLECNENVKHKAKEFVHKYMSKFGSEFKKEKTLSPRDF